MDSQGTSPPAGTKIEKELTGDPIPIGTRTFQPVARVAGWYGATASETASAAGAWLRVTPVKVIVREGEDREYEVAITDPTRDALRGITLASVMVAVLSLVIAGVVRLAIGRRKSAKRRYR